MSRSNPKVTQPYLQDVKEPKQVTVNGDGFAYWAARAKAGEVHIYRFQWDRKRNAIMHLDLLWLHGRVLQTMSDVFTPVLMVPLRGAQMDKAKQLAWEAFK